MPHQQQRLICGTESLSLPTVSLRKVHLRSDLSKWSTWVNKLTSQVMTKNYLRVHLLVHRWLVFTSSPFTKGTSSGYLQWRLIAEDALLNTRKLAWPDLDVLPRHLLMERTQCLPLELFTSYSLFQCQKMLRTSMCVCVCVCTSAYVCVCMYEHVYVRTCAYVCMHVYACVHVCACVCEHATYECVGMHVLCACTCIWCMCVMCMCVCACVSVCACE